MTHLLACLADQQPVRQQRRCQPPFPRKTLRCSRPSQCAGGSRRFVAFRFDFERLRLTGIPSSAPARHGQASIPRPASTCSSRTTTLHQATTASASRAGAHGAALCGPPRVHWNQAAAGQAEGCSRPRGRRAPRRRDADAWRVGAPSENIIIRNLTCSARPGGTHVANTRRMAGDGGTGAQAA